MKCVSKPAWVALVLSPVFLLPAFLLPACVLVVSLGCTTEPSADAGPASGAAPSTAKKGIALTCQPVSDLEDGPKTAIEGAARAVADLMRTGTPEDLWKSLHPQALDEGQHDAFIQAAQGMQRRLASSGEETRVEHAYFVDVRGGVTDLARIECPHAGAPDGLTLIANAGDEDIAVVTLLTDGTPFGYATSVTLRKRGTHWRLLGVQVGPASYRGKNAEAYEKNGDDLIRSGETLEGYLALGLAQQLADRGASIKPAQQLRIDGKLAEVAGSHELADHLGPLILDGKTYDVLGASLAATQSDVSAVIKYVSPGGLVKEILDQEADVLIAHLRRNYPNLGKLFPAVVFEAYANKPTTPEAEYDAYRIVRSFEASAVAAP